ncbi:MAG TPA: hypothetical protein VFJ16_30800 [Longimicrobium sp.]|nr:hypothetical protein [Longimicrobium sp.]
MSAAHLARDPWNPARPGVLVIACSDGRLQEQVDEFLAARGITHYDRLYVPGGPGALSSSGVSYARADQFRRECMFLFRAHGIEDVYLIYHGAAEDGPADATCADYRLKLPTHTPAQIREQQQRDAHEMIRDGFGWNVNPRIHSFRCEITGRGAVQFVELDTRPASVPPPVPLSM